MANCLTTVVPPRFRLLFPFILLVALTLQSKAQPRLDEETETLITKLPAESAVGFGYSSQFSGTQFLPDHASSEVTTLVLGSGRPTNSIVLEQIVRKGISAVPSLLHHLDDAKNTKIPAIRGMMWIKYNDEYDFNRRVETNAPPGVNRDAFGEAHPAEHAITVGDLCFVALGQIVNRRFNATRYQPSGGVIVSSPTSSHRLREVIRTEFKDFTTEKHRKMLIDDFETPDSEERRLGAYRRLVLYYPNLVEPLVANQITIPTFDVFKIEKFVREQLYLELSLSARQTLLASFLEESGPAYSEGVILQLFGDLNTQEASGQNRIYPRQTKTYDARKNLVELFQFPPIVNSTNRPYAKYWSASEKERFIKVVESQKNATNKNPSQK